MRRAAENGDWGRDVGALDVSEPDAHPRAARTDCSIQSPASHSMLASLCDPAYAQELFVLRWCWRTGASFGKQSGHHVGLVQEDGRAGTEGRRTAAGHDMSSL